MALRRLQLLLAAGATASTARGQFLELDPIFGDGAVLQMVPARAAVWGRAPPSAGTAVTLSLDGETVAHAVVDADGTWSTTLPPQDPGYNHTLSVAAAAGQPGGSKTATVSFGHVSANPGWHHNFPGMFPGCS